MGNKQPQTIGIFYGKFKTQTQGITVLGIARGIIGLRIKLITIILSNKNKMNKCWASSKMLLEIALLMELLRKINLIKLFLSLNLWVSKDSETLPLQTDFLLSSIKYDRPLKIGKNRAYFRRLIH